MHMGYDYEFYVYNMKCNNIIFIISAGLPHTSTLQCAVCAVPPSVPRHAGSAFPKSEMEIQCYIAYNNEIKLFGYIYKLINKVIIIL